MKKIKILPSILVSISLFFNVSCKDENNTETKPSSDTVSKNNDNKNIKKISIAMVTFPGYAPLYLAKEKGLFKDIDVSLNRIESISDQRAAMQSGKIDIYASTYDIFQSNEGNDVPGTGFLLIDESHGADGIIANGNINSIKDLKGKKIAAEPGLPPYFLLQYQLNKVGLSMSDIIIKDMPTGDISSAFVSDQVEAAAIYEPSLSKAIKAKKGSKLLLSSKDTPNLLADLLFASDNLIKNNPDALLKIANGWFQALDYIKSNPDESYKIMSKAFNVSSQEMIDFQSGVSWSTKNDNIKMFNINNKPNVYSIFDDVGKVLIKNNPKTKKFRPEDKLSDKIIKLLN